MCYQLTQHRMVGIILLGFKGDIAYFASYDIVVADGISRRGNEEFVAKI